MVQTPRLAYVEYNDVAAWHRKGERKPGKGGGSGRKRGSVRDCRPTECGTSAGAIDQLEPPPSFLPHARVRTRPCATSLAAAASAAFSNARRVALVMRGEYSRNCALVRAHIACPVARYCANGGTVAFTKSAAVRLTAVCCSVTACGR